MPRLMTAGYFFILWVSTCYTPCLHLLQQQGLARLMQVRVIARNLPQILRVTAGNVVCQGLSPLPLLGRGPLLEADPAQT